MSAWGPFCVGVFVCNMAHELGARRARGAWLWFVLAFVALFWYTTPDIWSLR